MLLVVVGAALLLPGLFGGPCVVGTLGSQNPLTTLAFICLAAVLLGFVLIAWAVKLLWRW